jgi:hypothetical protein
MGHADSHAGRRQTNGVLNAKSRHTLHKGVLHIQDVTWVHGTPAHVMLFIAFPAQVFIEVQSIMCQFYPNRKTNVETADRNSFTPRRKYGFHCAD